MRKNEAQSFRVSSFEMYTFCEVFHQCEVLHPACAVRTGNTKSLKIKILDKKKTICADRLF